MNRFADFSIKSKLIISILTLLTLSLGLYSMFILFMSYQENMSSLIKQSKLQSQLVADYTVAPLLFSDKNGAMDVLSKLKTMPNINAAVIYDEQKKVFAIYTKNKINKKTFNHMDKSRHKKDEILISTPIVYQDHTYGTILLYISTKEIKKMFFNTALVLFASTFLLIILSLFTIYKIQHYITYPIINLAQLTKEITLSENYSTRAEKFYKDEVGNLYDDFNSMLDKIEQRGRERDEAETISRTYQAHLERLADELETRVKERTIELQESLNNLQNAQEQLVESEKMSALGNLVAGVAHEVNTPLGISITAASIFANEVKELKKAINENNLSKSKLMHFIETLSEADDILVKNLNRAALLVKNFKKISVDQSSEDIREFELNSYLQEVFSTFKSELKHRPITLKTNFSDEKIQMYSYPGAIAQVIINMLQNTLLHAFEPEQEGEIILKTYQDGDKAVIRFADNGKGIDKKVLDTIFEPFVTTKRNKGGTGLGLNITYNLVTQHLKGSIKLDKENCDGACFLIEIPMRISDNKDENNQGQESLSL